MVSKLAKFLVAGVALAAAAVFIACDDDDAPEVPTPPNVEGPIGLNAAVSALPRTSGDADQAPAVASAGLALGLDILDELPVDENRLISPYSIQIALAMTRVGARGETLEEMDAVLRTGMTDNYDEALNALDRAVTSRAGELPQEAFDEGEPDVIELGTANALWGQTGFPFEQPFLDTLAQAYGAGMNLVDYVNATEAARELINGWVSDQTSERIPELIQQGVLSVDTRLVLSNAVYLKVPWLAPFDPDDTNQEVFHLLDGGVVDVDMMHRSVRTGFAGTADYEAVSLTYAGRQLSMLLIVPREGRFEAVTATLTAEEIGGIIRSLTDSRVSLAMPRFEYRTPVNLSSILEGLGMPTAFNKDKADFGGITSVADLYISDVVHEAFISVDEAGTEAAASTAVVITTTSAPQPATLTIDRPFLFLIRDNETGAALFLGSVVDPTAGE